MSGKALHPDHEDFFSALGRRIKEVRIARGLTLRDMVVSHGYHASQWQKYEKGCPITVDSLLRIATVYGFTLSELLGGLADFPRADVNSVEAGPVPTKRPAKTSSHKVTKKSVTKVKK